MTSGPAHPVTAALSVLTVFEQAELRRRWEAFVADWRLWEERLLWLNANLAADGEPAHPLWKERRSVVSHQTRQLGIEGDRLALWLGCTPGELVDRLFETLAEGARSE